MPNCEEDKRRQFRLIRLPDSRSRCSGNPSSENISSSNREKSLRWLFVHLGHEFESVKRGVAMSHLAASMIWLHVSPLGQIRHLWTPLRTQAVFRR